MQIASGKAMDDARKFEDLVQFRAPTNLSKAIETAAKQRCQSKSDYIRQSIVDRLRSDGINLREIAGRAACALLVCALVASSAMAAGTIPLSMTQQFGSLGKPLGGGQLFLIKAGTVSEPQNCFQDVGLTIPWPNPITLDAAGRVPQLFCADGSIKVRLTDKNGVQQLVADNVLVIGPSAGGGGGGTVDPTTIFQTGAFMQFYGTGILSGWVRANGRTIGGPASGATERANSDCQALFAYLWGADANLAVSGGRGASGAADWAANKTIALPDLRGRTIAGLDDMGASPAGRLTATYFGATATILGTPGGVESRTLTAAQLPSSIPYTDPGHIHGVSVPRSTSTSYIGNNDQAYIGASNSGVSSWVSQSATTGITINPSGGQAHATVQPTMLATTYLKL
ncbi:hypothetical protein I3J27_38760 [Bradyrhizobium xenonodulans]|uniref:Phage tail collar domain-containing protein n=1 Tax=Bradyrhizobium xenonodulans TaxID=2736875 RepID=A0ABY7MMH2_9BRAD|nr:hypothetical protein [Bradyrhizobium xenonodulans]WBL78806.1 hypothetical protein I3J27_38760 [Bradyrhizobium xenonodulans]